MQEEEEERQRAIEHHIALYRNVFSGPSGTCVLADILANCHFLEPLDAGNPQMIGEYNVGIYLLASLGVMKPDNRIEVVNNLLGQNPLLGTIPFGKD